MNKRHFNLVLSILYAVVSISVFVALEIITSAAPLAIALLVIYLYRDNITSNTLFVFSSIIAGIFLSPLLFINFIKGIRQAISTPKKDSLTEDPKILSLVQSVADDVGVSRFSAVYLNSGLDISTSYVGRERYLNLSVIALKYLSEGEMKAVIAHECAHHHNNAMLLNRTHNRTVIFFNSFRKALLSSLTAFNKYRYNNILFYEILKQSGFATLPLTFCFNLYYHFLLLMGILIKDAEYEYYCDSVGAKYVGGNIMASALQKIFDLHIADSRFLEKIYNQMGIEGKNNKDKQKSLEQNSIEWMYLKRLNNEYKNIEHMYLEGVNKEFLHVRYFNAPDRIQEAAKQSDTHPPVKLRLEKVQAYSTKVDLSEPLLSEAEAKFYLQKTLEPLLKTIKQNRNEVNTGQCLVIFSQKRTLVGIFSKYEIYIDDQCIGTIRKSTKEYFEITPGFHTIYIKNGNNESDSLDIIISTGEQIEVNFCTLPDYSIYIGLR